MKTYSTFSTWILLASLMGTANAGLMIKERGEDGIETQIYQDGMLWSTHTGHFVKTLFIIH